MCFVLKKCAFNTANSKPNQTKRLKTQTQKSGVAISLKMIKLLKICVVFSVEEVHKKV